MKTHDDYGAYTSRSLGPEDFIDSPSIDASDDDTRALSNNDIVCK